jgi:hypothetical protein
LPSMGEPSAALGSDGAFRSAPPEPAEIYASA